MDIGGGVGLRNRCMGGFRDGLMYGFSSLLKQNKKAKICAVICFAGKKKLLFHIYTVIVKKFFRKRFRLYYSHSRIHMYKKVSACTSTQVYISIKAHV